MPQGKAERHGAESIALHASKELEFFRRRYTDYKDIDIRLADVRLVVKEVLEIDEETSAFPSFEDRLKTTVRMYLSWFKMNETSVGEGVLADDVAAHGERLANEQRFVLRYEEDALDE